MGFLFLLNHHSTRARRQLLDTWPANVREHDDFMSWRQTMTLHFWLCERVNRKTYAALVRPTAQRVADFLFETRARCRLDD